MEKRTEKIAVESTDELSVLLGVFDENLSIISRETGVDASVLSDGIKIAGDAENVDVAKRVIEKLLELIKNREPIDKSRIIYCVELAKEGYEGDIGKIMSGVIAVTSRGKQIKYKTLGQKNISTP